MPKKKDNILRIGDKVKVTNVGSIYTSYKEMFDRLNFRKQRINYRDALEGDLGIVFAIAEHPKDPKTILVAVEITSRDSSQILINIDGLRKL